jgi:hypothetical protein
VREIQGHLTELYGLEVSPDLISTITGEVMEEVTEWQNRPLEQMYPLVFFDALRVKIRDEGTVKNKAVYLALGVCADGTKEILGIWDRANRRCQILAARHDGIEEPRPERHADRRGRRLERLPLHSTRNTRPPFPEKMLENEAKNRTKTNYKNQIRTSFVQKNHPTSSLAQGAEGKNEPRKTHQVVAGAA